jgi:parallel beta-helix repeat protein
VYVSKVSGAQIAHNTLTGAKGSGDGIVVDGANAAVTVTSNTLKGFAGAGVQLGFALPGSSVQPPTTGATVTGNTISRCGTGVGLLVAQGNVVSANKVSSSTAYGLDVDSASSGNTASNNTVQGSKTLDCEDLSKGSGTSGTADTWTANIGASSSPAGLCGP